MKLAVVNIGGQYNHMIHRTILDSGIDAEMVGLEINLEKLRKMNVDGVVMGGGPQRIGTDDNGPFAGVMEIMREVTIPQLTICATHQLLAIVHGGTAGPAGQPEYGMGEVFVEEEGEILAGLKPKFTALLTHNDEVKKMPKDFVKFAHSEHCKVQAMKHKKYPLYGVQFHPETVHTQGSALIFENFKRICKK